jgi:hypothetical protein
MHSLLFYGSEKKFRIFEKMEGLFYHVMPVMGLKRPNIRKDDDDDDKVQIICLAMSVSYIL